MSATEQPAARRRVPAAERREELIKAAVHEFSHGGLHGTTVESIARRVGVAQPYVFSLFPTKRELFLAALERSFERVADTFRGAAADFEEGRGPEQCEDALEAMGRAYTELLTADRDYLMLQHQSYAACDDELVRARVRHRYAELVELARSPFGRGARAAERLLPHRHGPQRRCRPRRRGPVDRLRMGAGGAALRTGAASIGEAMSAPAQTPGQAQPKAPRRGRREQSRTVALLVLAILITLFAVFNVEQVKVSWIFGSGKAPLIIVIVLSVLVGVVFTHFAERRSAKRQ